MTKKESVAALKKAGYSLLNPPDPRSDHYPAYLILKGEEVAMKRKIKFLKNKIARTPEQIAERKEKRRLRRKRYRANMAERYANKSKLHTLPNQAKATGKTVAQLIVEQWSKPYADEFLYETADHEVYDRRDRDKVD